MSAEKCLIYQVSGISFHNERLIRESPIVDIAFTWRTMASPANMSDEWSKISMQGFHVVILVPPTSVDTHTLYTSGAAWAFLSI